MSLRYRGKKTERGQALIMIALAMVGLAGMVGLVVDGGNAFLDRRNAQNAADSAALAAALTRGMETTHQPRGSCCAYENS